MRFLVTALATGLIAGPVLAAEMTVTVEIPRLTVAEYHRPYVAVWIERPDQSAVANLAVWYDTKLANNEGATWLKDMRQWWRRIGRTLDMPVDGVSGATRAPGSHAMRFSDAEAPLAGLASGEYRLVVEASREVGGRELLRIPFTWPPQGPESLNEEGRHEFGRISLDLAP